MPWGYECKANFVKQLPAKPTEKRGDVAAATTSPGPNIYETPEIFCGKGYSGIKRAPAYTFGQQIPISLIKPVLKGTAPMLDTCGMGPKGAYKIKHGTISPRMDSKGQEKTPGPANYVPRLNTSYKRPPAYTMRPAARPVYQSGDQWTPSPNMYLPYIPGKKFYGLQPSSTLCVADKELSETFSAQAYRNYPAYSFGNVIKDLSQAMMPCPGTYEPNFKYVEKSKPSYSFGAPWKTLRPHKIPPPNTYCEKKFMYNKRTIPAPSFGIRHTPHLGKQQEYLKSSELDLVIS